MNVWYVGVSVSVSVNAQVGGDIGRMAAVQKLIFAFTFYAGRSILTLTS